MKLKHVLGTVTIIAIVGGTIYAIKKSKDLEKSEGEAITLEEARAEVEARRKQEKPDVECAAYIPEDSDKYDIVSVDDYHDLISENFSESRRQGEGVSILVDPYEEYDEDYEDEFDDQVEGPKINEKHFEVKEVELVDDSEDSEDFDLEKPWAETMTEEDKVLRYEPSSIDAIKQYRRMELAEWAPSEDAYQTMMRMFDFPFKPHNDGDDLLRTQIIDYRVQFFGFGSKWTQQVTYADVILHYARAAEFNCGESVKYWVEYFLDFNDLYHAYSGLAIDQTLMELNKHAYFNEERQTFGLFGLTRDGMEQSIKIANRNIDRSVTYEIEFNEFLKSFL